MTERDIPHAAVAQVLGTARSYVSEHTNGKRAPDTDLLDAVATLAGLTTHELVQQVRERMAESSMADVVDSGAITPPPALHEADVASGAEPVAPSAEGIESTTGPKIVTPKLRPRKQRRTGTPSHGHNQ